MPTYLLCDRSLEKIIEIGQKADLTDEDVQTAQTFMKSVQDQLDGGVQGNADFAKSLAAQVAKFKAEFDPASGRIRAVGLVADDVGRESQLAPRTRKELRRDNNNENRTGIIVSAGYTAGLLNSMGSTRTEFLVGTATGKLLESSDWRYSLSIDYMIARVHDVDPELPWNGGALEQARN